MAILGVGTEIVECVRIAKMIETHGEQFLERVYTANEIEYCVRSAISSRHFATRWAAKEAAMKAMRCRNQGVLVNHLVLPECTCVVGVLHPKKSDLGSAGEYKPPEETGRRKRAFLRDPIKTIYNPYSPSRS